MKKEAKPKDIYDGLLEPVLVLDVKEKCISYCNDACQELWDVWAGMKIPEFLEKISTDLDYEELEKKLIHDRVEYFTQEARIFTLEQGAVEGELRGGYVRGQTNLVYFLFQYKADMIKNVVLKNRYFDSIYSESYSYPFRLDIKAKAIYFIGPILEQFQLPPVIYDYPYPVIESGVLHEDDIDNFINMVSDMYRGAPTTYSFRAYTVDEGQLWYQPHYTVNRNEQGEPVELLGEFVNIQEKMELETLLHTDELTKCLNKASFQKFTEEALQESKPGQQHALFIIDIDNFKLVNDNLGHHFGDIVLRETGETLSRIFRQKDHVGRIGGDEFMVFMHDIEDDTMLHKCAERIREALDQTYKGNMREYRTTASIGVVKFPENGTDFEELYKRADLALYNTKSKGKNGVTYYNDTMVNGSMSNTTPFDIATRVLSQHFDQELIIDIFSLLSDAKDHNASINKVLELLGLRFKASRSYIFEYSGEDDRFMDNTYEWCAPGITPEIENLQMVPRVVYEPFIEKMNENGVFYCNNLEDFRGEESFDVMHSQGIISFLFAFNVIGGNVVNMVGFDDCNSKRIWSSIEIGTLMHASKIVNQFLKYTQAIEAVKDAAREKLKVLDEIYSYAYITDEETHRLHYFNQEFQDDFPEAKFGDICYEVLHNKTQACLNCPMKRMKKQNRVKFRCVMPLQTQNKNMLVNTSEIGEFNGQNSVFFSCSSIDDLDEE